MIIWEKMKVILINIILVVLLCFISCESSPTFSSWYNPWLDTNILQNMISLKEGEEPQIITSSNIDNDFFNVLSNHYYCIGDTSFNGPDDDLTKDIKKQCQQNGAMIALYSKSYTDTRSGITGYGNYIGSYNIRRYDYIVYYFIPLPMEFQYRLNFGIDAWEIPNNMREEIGRNTGAYVNVVYKNTPAFFANILRNDVIIRINEYNINTYKNFYDILNTFNAGDELEVEFVRKDQNHITKVKL